MRRLLQPRKLCVLALLLVAFVGFTPGAAPQSDPVCAFSSLKLKSALLGRSIGYRVCEPLNYDRARSAQKRFPVIYLLHGLSGHHTNWVERTRIAYVRPHDLFIVLVEGDDGWYTDSASVPTDKYESYIIQELMPEVEKQFQVSTKREGRAIAGLSMGGYGAIKFGFKYPTKFAFVASMSGAFDAASWRDDELKSFEFIRQSIQKTFGPPGSATRAANDLLRMTREVSADGIKALPFIYLDCGTDDFLFQTNRDYVALLAQRKIPHEFRQVPGTHSWPYWDRQIQEIMRIAAGRLAPPK